MTQEARIKEQLMRVTPSDLGGVFVGPGLNQVSKEPSISKRSQELFSYLAELDTYLGHIRGRLFGELENDEPAQRTEPNSIEGVIARACELSAMLLSQAKGIESRL